MEDVSEAELVRASRSGAVVDGEVSQGRRTLSATALRACCHELRNQVDPRGVRLKNVTVTGCLDLAGLAVPFPLRLEGCGFDTAPTVEGAELFELSITGSSLPGLAGNGVRVRRDLDLSRSTVSGAHWTSASTSKRSAIWLCESEIGGRLLMVDTAIDGQGDRSIQADRMQVGGTVRLIHRFTARGEIRLLGARINGSLDLTGAHVTATDGPAIELADATIAGSVFLIEDPDHRRPQICGRIDLGSARVGGRFLIRNAALEARGDAPKRGIYARAMTAHTALDASRLSVGADVLLGPGCDVTGRVDLSMSDMSVLSIREDCVLRAPGRTALDLTNAEIRALLRLDQNATVEGTIRLAGAVIHGTLALHGAMSRPEHRSLVGGSAMTVDGDVFLDGLRTDGGRVDFRGATLGSLAASDARLNNPSGYTVSLRHATVRGTVRLGKGVIATGLTVLSGATIDGRLLLTGSFTCPAAAPRNERGHAIEMISATVRGGIDLGWEAISPSLDFTNTTTTFLADNPATWPERFAIAGLTYDRFERPQHAPQVRVWDHVARCEWLSRQITFESGPYEQVAKVFREHGYTSEAEEILIEQRRHARRVGRSSANWPRRAMTAAHAAIGYGYRPWRVLWALAVLLILVTASLELPAGQATLRATNGNGYVYSTRGLLATPHGLVASHAPASGRPPDSCGDGEVRCFSPVLYAIDTVLPLVSLDQRSTWYPDPHVRGGELIMWWLNAATLLGWLLSSIFVLSLARLSRSP